MDFIISPFTVATDTREQAVYSWRGMTAVHKGKQVPLIVKTESKTLESGDYSIVGLEHAVAVERKTKEDGFQTFGRGRARFERELERLNKMQFACVLIEDEWSGLIMRPPPHSEMNPKSVDRSILAWMQRYTRVHWVLRPGRAAAERTAYWILERFWRDVQEGKRGIQGPEEL